MAIGRVGGCRMSRTERKIEIEAALWHAHHEYGGRAYSTQEIAAHFGLAASQYLRNILYEMVDEGTLRMEGRDYKGAVPYAFVFSYNWKQSIPF